MRLSRLVTSTYLHKAGCYPQTCTLEWWMLALYKFCRLFFICVYYYMMPFLIIIFQVLLLYFRLMQAQIELERQQEEQANSATLDPSSNP